MALNADRFHALPLAGGTLEQPPRLLRTIRALLEYRDQYALVDASGDKAPPEVRRRVYQVAARAARARED